MTSFSMDTERTNERTNNVPVPTFKRAQIFTHYRLYVRVHVCASDENKRLLFRIPFKINGSFHCICGKRTTHTDDNLSND